jgi:hypothetical protein
MIAEFMPISSPFVMIKAPPTIATVYSCISLDKRPLVTPGVFNLPAEANVAKLPK